MKTRIVILLAALMATVQALKAQEETDFVDLGSPTEVSVSYGGAPAMRWMKVYSDHWNKVSPWGAVAVSLDHRFASRLWLGMSYSISSSSTNDASEGRKGDVTWHSLMVHGRYIYTATGRWQLYGSAGVGVIISYMQPSWQPTYNRTHFAFQAVPLGAQFRVLGNFDIFAEAGYGVQGVVRAGVRVDL